MAILVQPGRFRYRVHSNGHGTRNTPKRNQHQTAYETWTESPAVHRIAIGKHGRPALGAKDRDRQITSVKQRRYSCNPGRGRNDADKGGSKMSAKKGSLGGEMRMRINEHCINKSNKTRRNYLKSCASFDKWRKDAGLSNRVVRSDPRRAVEKWRDALREKGYADSTIHTYVAGVACGLHIDMTGITHHGTSETKTKSLGLSERSKAALLKERNADIVKFQRMVGGRRAALGKLTGSDMVIDESGYEVVKFTNDKGGKTQLQRIAPEHINEVRHYFDRVGPTERLFPYIDKDLDLHGLRAARARSEYLRYEKICATPEGQAQMRHELWARYKDPNVGCAAYLKAKERGDKQKMRRMEYLFSQEMAPGKYHMRGANRRVAISRGLPTALDRLSLICTSVFALSHWRSDVTLKHYIL